MYSLDFKVSQIQPYKEGKHLRFCPQLANVRALKAHDPTLNQQEIRAVFKSQIHLLTFQTALQGRFERSCCSASVPGVAFSYPNMPQCTIAKSAFES